MEPIIQRSVIQILAVVLCSHHFAQDDVDGDGNVDFLNLPLLERRHRVRVHEPDAESGQNFFVTLLRFRVCETVWQRGIK